MANPAPTTTVDEKAETAHIDVKHAPTSKEDASVGLAVIDQRAAIPTTGKRKPTSKWEYVTFCMFYFSNNGAPIGGNGGALRQALMSQEFPEGKIHWGGTWLPSGSEDRETN